VGSGTHLCGGDSEAVGGGLGNSICYDLFIDPGEAGEQGDQLVGFWCSV
jgi:hypothetical protein